MRGLLIGLLIGAFACSSAPVERYSGADLPRFESKPLPERPDKDPIPEQQNYTYPLLRGTAAPADGVLISPEKAARALLFKESYNELRKLYELDRDGWVQVRIAYDERLKQANAEIKRLQPNWWDQNKGSIAFISGIVIGAAVTVGLVFAVDQAEGN